MTRLEYLDSKICFPIQLELELDFVLEFIPETLNKEIIQQIEEYKYFKEKCKNLNVGNYCNSNSVV